MRKVTIRIEIDDVDNKCKMESEHSLENYIGLKNMGVDLIQSAVKLINNNIDERLKNDKARAHINLGETYFLDLGSSHPIEVRPTEFTLDGRVKCDFLSSYPGKTDILDANLF